MNSVSRPVKSISPQISRSSRTLNLTVAQQARPQLAKQITRPVKQVSVYLDRLPSEDIDFVLLYQTAKLLGG